MPILNIENLLGLIPTILCKIAAFPQFFTKSIHSNSPQHRNIFYV